MLELGVIDSQGFLEVDEVRDLVDGRVAELEYLLHRFLSEEILAKEGLVDILIQLRHKVVFVNLVVYVGVEVMTHVEVKEKRRSEELRVLNLKLLIDSYLRLEVKGLNAHFLLEGLEVKDFKEALLEEHHHLVGRAQRIRLELHDLASEPKHVEHFRSLE